MKNPSHSDRRAQALFDVFQQHSDRRLSESQLLYRREEVNQMLGELGDDAIAQTLGNLYRLAEADARKNARVLTRAIREPQAESWLSLLRRKLPFPWRRGSF